MTREPFIAHSELTNEIYIVVGKEKYRVTEQAIKAVMAIKVLEKEPISDKYEYHIDHTDCIWYGNDSGCPVTCSQYRDGWNDAMEYIFKGGKGYHPYKREV